MRPEPPVLASPSDRGPLARLDPSVKLVVTFLFVVGVVATPNGWWRTLSAEAAILAIVVGISRLNPLDLIRRWLSFAVLIGFLAVTVALGHPQRGSLGWAVVAGSIAIKNALAFTAMLVLSSVTPFPKLLQGLSRLGAPKILIATLHFMYRYSYVLISELGRMVQARRSRSFRRWGMDWGLLTSLIGVLFLRAMERGERVHAAMLARGWDGTIRTLDGPDSP